MTYKSHRLDVYNTGLFLATTRKQWKQLAKKCKLIEADVPDCAGQVSSGVWQPKTRGLAEHHVVVWINVKQHGDQGELLDTCAHEASHAAGRILEHIGHPVPATDEPHAYLVGWLTRWIYEACHACQC